MFRTVVLAAGLSLSLLASALEAQTGSTKANPPPERTAADIEWESLEAFSRPRPAAMPTDEKERAAARKKQASDLVAQADRIKEFYDKNPNHARVKDAKFLEARTLFLAAEAGDASQEARRKTLVESIRRDPGLAVGKRSEISAWAANWEIRQQKNLTIPERLEAHEQVARSLAVEFPTVPEVYESLYAIARSRDDEKGRQLMQDLLTMPAPDTVKAQARQMIERYALEGRSLGEVATAAAGANSPAAQAKGVVVIYTWASWSKGSLALASRLPSTAPSGATFIGVCLDTDLNAARAAAQAAGLPGTQIYDSRGGAGALAQQLRLTEPTLVYLTDANGLITTVSGVRQLLAAAGSSSGK